MSFVPPPYPYDRLAPVIERAGKHRGGAIDCSIGTPCDPPPAFVAEALGETNLARSYPPSIGTQTYRESAARWMARRFGVDPSILVRACIGTKEFVATTPHLLRLRSPERDTVLYPEISYPTYAMGAQLAGCRAVPVPLNVDGSMDFAALEGVDPARVLCVWANTPSNPTGSCGRLDGAVEWCRDAETILISDECYAEFTWAGEPHSVLQVALDGVIAVHSLSKRSNFAGARAGFYAGDRDLVEYLGEVRKHLGMMVPGGVQAAGALAWDDDIHVREQRERYASRLARLAQVMEQLGASCDLPDGAFYLWVAAPEGDAWAFAAECAERVGLVIAPGEFYGAASSGFVRVAAVVPDADIDRLMERLGR